MTAEQRELSSNADADLVTVHFVPHSHMDAGWLLSFDKYYDQQVHTIFEQVFAALK